MEQSELSYTIDTVWKYLLKLNIGSPYNPAIILLSIYPKYPHAHQKSSISVFIAALLMIGLNWKQPKCPSAAEGINQLWYIHIIE